MELENRRKNKENRGMSIIEVICAVAIFSLIVVMVGTVIVISSRTYRSGSTETVIQQEAQFAANRISDLIKDSVEVSFSGSENVQGSYGRLVMNHGNRKYVVALADGSNRLMYGEADVSVDDEAIVADELLAEHMVSFRADTAAFEEANTVRLEMTLESDGREYVMNYNITARNEDVTQDSVETVKTAAIMVENRIILEPGQSYEIPVQVFGSSQGIDVESGDETQLQVTATIDGVLVTLEPSAGMTQATIPIYIATREKTGVTPLATATVEIQIRRVDALAIHSTILTGEDGKAGAAYKFVSSMTEYTPYLAKKPLVSWDEDYKNPYAVQWDYENNLWIGGSTADFYEYFEVIEKEEDIDTPYLILKLKKDLVVGASLTVEGIAKHAAIDGGNKCGVAYNTEVKASALLVGPGLSGMETEILEPGEIYSTSLPVAECDITTTPELETLQSRGTTVNFADGEFQIQLGKDETGDSNGKIVIELRAVGDMNVNNVRTIEIYVRRLNSMRLELKHLTGDGHEVQEPLVKGSDYQFCTRMKGTNMNKAEGEEESEFLPNPYAIEFSWEFKINGVIQDVPGATGSVIWEDYDHYAKYGDYGKRYPDNPATNPGNEYYAMVGVATNSEQPCINFVLTGDFPMNGELIVTAKALHPAGKDADGTLRNQTGIAYVEGGIIASAAIEGEKVEYLPTFLRGQDFGDFPDSHELDNFPWELGYDGNWFVRSREILGEDENGKITYGPWTTYRKTRENQSYKKLNAIETRMFLPDRAYQIEMAYMEIDPDTQTIYWPYDKKLVAEDSGTGFEGYNVNWDESTQQTAKSAYSSTYIIDRAYVTYKQDDTYVKCYGSLEEPVVLNVGSYFSVDLGGYGISYQHYQGKSISRVEELVDNTWVEVGNKGWGIQDRSSFFTISNIQESAKGTYRISFWVDDYDGADWTTWNGDIWDPVYETLQNADALLCDSDANVGYLYIRIE